MLAGKYRLTRLLGHGGMGSVWAAEHVGLHAEVAVKLMKRSLASDPALRSRFEREAQAAARLKGPHTVAVHDVGVDEGMPFLVMERLEGEDLGQRLKHLDIVPPRAALWIVDQVGRALYKAHTAGLVHRDLKPSNVFLAKTDEGETVKILDFGVAKIIGKMPGIESTNTTSMIGSPAYMSPEQIRSARDVDGRSDLWSLGVVAYRMLTGRLPFEGATAGDLLVKSCTEPAPPPSAIQKTLDPAWDELFGVALAKEPARRFQSARAFVEAFTNVARGGVGTAISTTSVDGPWTSFASPVEWAGLRHSRPSSDDTKIRALQADAETLIRDVSFDDPVTNRAESQVTPPPMLKSTTPPPLPEATPAPWPTRVDATIPIKPPAPQRSSGLILPAILLSLVCVLLVVGVLLVRAIIDRPSVVASEAPSAPSFVPPTPLLAIATAEPSTPSAQAPPPEPMQIQEVEIGSLSDAPLPTGTMPTGVPFPSGQFGRVGAPSATATPSTTSTGKPRMDLGLD